MNKSCAQSRKHLVLMSLSLQMASLVLSMTIPHDTGGGNDGDPAPGRSPGPPVSSYESSEESLEKAISDDVKPESYEDAYEEGGVGGVGNESSWCTSQPAAPEQEHLNWTLHHSLFQVAHGIVSGVTYRASASLTGTGHALKEVLMSATANGLPVGSWSDESFRTVCLGSSWIVQKLDEKTTVGWTLSEMATQPLNVTFRFRFRLSSGYVSEQNVTFPVAHGCVLWLRHSQGDLGSADLPDAETCKIVFPRDAADATPARREGLLIDLTKLNVPCSNGGYIQFAADEEDSNNLEEERSSTPRTLCGKLEELSASERKLYFPSLSEANVPFLVVHKNPVFALNYRLVDYCYNVTFTSRNGSLVLNPVKNLLCHFRVHLPYGNRVLLRLQMGEDKSTSTTQNYEEKAQIVENSGKLKLSSSNYTTIHRTLKRSTSPSASNGVAWNEMESERECEGLFVVVWDGSLTWTHCSKHGDPKRDIQVWSQENVVTIKIIAQAADDDQSFPVVKFWYHAEPDGKIVGLCDFGEILMKQFCVSAVRVKLDWNRAEQYCVKRGGHLASIRDENAQNIIDNLLINSPEYRDHNSYWVGASDKTYEGHFRWSDGFAFSYSNWFPGWSQHGYYNRQPNDDGFSHQDCVEIRRTFPYPSPSRVTDAVTSSFLWNDLDCNTKNFFLCERVQNGEPSEQSWSQECNRTVTLSRETPRTTVVSPGFPHQYPDNVKCETVVVAPSGFRLLLDFEELVMEKEPTCSYDYLQLVETSWNNSYVTRRLCGDMSDKLKLLRYISQGPRMKFIFVSDYSHHYGGFKARVSIENAGMECADEKHKMFNNSCYLFVSYPKVTWQTARQICTGMKAELASVQGPEEENFITSNIRNSPEYTTSAVYWLGGFIGAEDEWLWTDDVPMEYTAWLPDDAVDNSVGGPESCLAVKWVSSRPESELPASGLYWTPHQCKKTGGYVCKKGNQASGVMLNLNRTINGTEGHLTSPGHPGQYYHNLDYIVHLVGPVWTRMVITFTRLDLEFQADCLYDFIEIRSGGSDTPDVRWCESRTSTRHNFISNNNEAVLRFHSDYSVAGTGFAANWRAIDITGCPSQKLTAREGILSSPNYPDFMLPHLDCTTTILAPPGKRIWLEFTDVSLTDDVKNVQTETLLELDLGGGTRPLQPFRLEGGLGDGNFISNGERMVVRLSTADKPTGSGFRAVYRTVSSVHEEKILDLTPESSGLLHHLNYPAQPPSHVDFVQHLVAPIGYTISLEFHQATQSEMGPTCPEGKGVIEVNDNYADTNGTWWFLCQVEEDTDLYVLPTPPLAIISYLHSLHIRQRSLTVGIRMNVTLKVKPDPHSKIKLLRMPEDGGVESCRPNPCQNGGKCLSSMTKKICQCMSHFTGTFCALTLCELEPCLFGQCELTGNGYHCRCQTGYTGRSCEVKQRPCADNPCEGRGECIERSDSFHCRCHAWWEGPRCEKKMLHIPFKPLSERMLQEPFWLGLITVFVVLGVIGIVWCAKRHFPEKLEKLLAEEADRHSRSNVSGSVRPPSVREQTTVASGAVAVSSPQGQPNCPRTLFGRLGIRKSSLLSLTSPQRQDTATSRTFSLDDLLRPSPRRTPSPRKKRTNSTPTKKNAAEKKQILQQLITPSSSQTQTTKVTLNELILLKEPKRRMEKVEKSDTDWKETSFTVPMINSDSKTDLSKLEKKVTFARLLNKVSAEMSSGSEVECTKPALTKALSTPVSPATDRKSPHSTSSNQGSDSLSSSEIAISGSAGNSALDIPGNIRRPTRLLSSRGAKNASADSILAMFRNFTSTSNVSSARISPSTTPTASSPQDDVAGSDDSSAIETPVSTSSGQAESPTNRHAYSTTIEIPVMDALTAQKNASNSPGNNLLQPPTILLEIPSGGISKCLSPIHEVPTPISSPALTPVMPRLEHESVKMDSTDEEPDKSDEDQSDGSSEMMFEVHQEDASTRDSSPVRSSFNSKLRPPVLNIISPDDEPRSGPVIPMLTIQEPSPTSATPPVSFLGSPPPQKPLEPFVYPPKSPPRRLLKELDKPNSLDLPYPPPMITVTCNISEADSDTESISPASKNQNLGPHNPTVNSAGMSYLSPFSMCSRADRTASESNLSSSGYSSMASPGPSRCGSNNPLCLSEVEDHQHSHSQPPSRRPSPLLRTPTAENNRSDEPDHRRGRSDSETLSDDPLMESNDEGIGTDHLDEKIEDGELKSARELEMFMGKDPEGQHFMEFGALIIPTPPSRSIFKKCDNLDCITPITKSSLQLPTIVVQSDFCDKLLSPVSSRSESPLSDKTLGLGRFSPMFYCKNKSDQLPFTDSDGLYDFPSSDCPPSNNKGVQAGTTTHRKRRERRPSYRTATPGSKTPSPTKGPPTLLDLPAKEVQNHRPITPRKPSPKRRSRTQPPLSSSSSTESLNAGKGLPLRLASPDGTDRPVARILTRPPASNEASGEDTGEDVSTKMLPVTLMVQEDAPKSQRKVSRLRTIGHQIRFLRRIELSLKRRERLVSLSDSGGEDDTDDASSSLLPRELRKSNSIGILHQSAAKRHRGNKKRNADLLLPRIRPAHMLQTDRLQTKSYAEERGHCQCS